MICVSMSMCAKSGGVVGGRSEEEREKGGEGLVLRIKSGVRQEEKRRKKESKEAIQVGQQQLKKQLYICVSLFVCNYGCEQLKNVPKSGVSLSFCSVDGRMMIPLPEQGTDTKQVNLDWAIDLFTSFSACLHTTGESMHRFCLTCPLLHNMLRDVSTLAKRHTRIQVFTRTLSVQQGRLQKKKACPRKKDITTTGCSPGSAKRCVCLLVVHARKIRSPRKH